MRLALCVLLVVGLGAWTRAQDPEPERLEGRWKGISLESEGQKAPPGALGDGGWTFKGSEVTFQDVNAPGKSAFKIDSSKDPRQIDLIAQEGPQNGKVMQGIYRIEGKRLTICLRDTAFAEKGRPTEFATKAGTGLAIIVLERADP